MEATRENAATEPEVEVTLDSVIEELRRTPGAESRLAILEGFARALHFRTPRLYFTTRRIGRLAAEIVEAFDFIDGRAEDEIRVRVFRVEETGQTLLQVNMNDQPFILDSVLETLRVHDVPIDGYLHPILQIDRDEKRRITAVRPRTSPGSHESFLHFRIGLPDEERRREIEREIHEALQDARRAVEDFLAMKERVDAVARELDTYPVDNTDERVDIEEAAAFLRWMLQENFVLLGYRAYRLFDEGGEEHIQAEPGSGLGILRDDRKSAFSDPTPVSSLNEKLQKRVRMRMFPLVAKTNRFSRVHRRAPMDYIDIKRIDAEGRVAGEHRILGLFTARALNQVCSEIPVLRRKLTAVLRRAQVLEGSHEYKSIITTFNSTPKAELFTSSVEQIGRNIDELIALQTSNEVRVFCEADQLDQRISVMVILPRERFNADIRKRVQRALDARFRVPSVEYRLALSEEAYVRLHFYYQDTTGSLFVPTRLALENAVIEAVRTWEDDFGDSLRTRFGQERGRELTRVYTEALPESYRTSVSPRLGVTDVEHLEDMRRTQQFQIAIVDSDGGPDVSSLRLYRAGEKYLLSEIMPVLTNLGLLVIDESTFAVGGSGLPPCHLHAIRIRKRNRQPIPRERRKDLCDAIRAILDGVYENDVFGELVVTAGLSIRAVELVRAYVHYFHQIGAPHDKDSIVSALSNHPDLTRLIVEYFETKFRPQSDGANAKARLAGPLTTLESRVTSGLEKVSDINEDRIIRGLFSLVMATVRTSYYQHGGTLDRMSFKIKGALVPGMPRPVPFAEIFVHNARMEGVHLRSGPVARGGIRWSDRRDDYRTEILGLMSTQITKNAIIVPVGSKGGFVLKRPPEGREELMAEVARQYETFIRGLLDVTDNRVGDRVERPRETMIYDDDDPYLVVAADKGTATFSDLGNRIAEEYGFWLDDAFASGGSHGYDHKKYGITARGAWECVRWHFLELGLDVDRDEFTVVGIGDMSGDVFGNGMLLSRKVKLVAAFDHRNIFIDPDPDPERSYKERQRLFELPRSSWNDYSAKLISAGGGVFPRLAKRIVLTPEMKRLFETDASAMSGEEMVRAMLRLPVDLLYNGGIGTYVKASNETHADVSDERNDSVRVDATELRCRVIGEGGNLGLTQAARVEFARRGGRINTDFIDNTGGVDLSDHEVNLKIALAPRVRDGTLSREARNELLEGIAPDVCELVLATNRWQARTLSLDETATRNDLSDHIALVEDLQARELLDRRRDRFPNAEELVRRREEGIGLLRPELSTLLAFAKIDIFRALAESGLTDSSGFEGYLTSYFPARVLEICDQCVDAHPLRREIAATVCTNEIVHRGGITFASRSRRDHGCTTVDVVRAYRASDVLLSGDQLFGPVVTDRGIPVEAWGSLVFQYRAALAEMVGWLVRSWPVDERREPQSVDAVVRRLAPSIERVTTWIDEEGLDSLRSIVTLRHDELVRKGVPEEIARRVGLFAVQCLVPGIEAIARTDSGRIDTVARVFFRIHEMLALPRVLGCLERLPVSGPGDRTAMRSLRHEILALTFELTAAAAPSNGAVAARAAVEHFVADQRPALRAYLDAADRTERLPTLAGFVVVTGRLRRLVDRITTS